MNVSPTITTDIFDIWKIQRTEIKDTYGIHDL